MPEARMSTAFLEKVIFIFEFIFPSFRVFPLWGIISILSILPHKPATPIFDSTASSLSLSLTHTHTNVSLFIMHKQNWALV